MSAGLARVGVRTQACLPCKPARRGFLNRGDLVEVLAKHGVSDINAMDLQDKLRSFSPRKVAKGVKFTEGGAGEGTERPPDKTQVDKRNAKSVRAVSQAVNKAAELYGKADELNEQLAKVEEFLSPLEPLGELVKVGRMHPGAGAWRQGLPWTPQRISSRGHHRCALPRRPDTGAAVAYSQNNELVGEVVDLFSRVTTEVLSVLESCPFVAPLAKLTSKILAAVAEVSRADAPTGAQARLRSAIR